jgi:hypothetical protein
MTTTQQENITEQWIRWEPIEGLAETYNITAVKHTADRLYIMLTEPDSQEKGIHVIFENSMVSYRETDESFVLTTIADLDSQYGTTFYSQWTFFRVTNSTYIKWFLKQSQQTMNIKGLMHFVLFEPDLLVDVIATREPRVEMIGAP